MDDSFKSLGLSHARKQSEKSNEEKKIGAVIASEYGFIHGEGYNHVPYETEGLEKEQRDKIIVHAEVAALMSADTSTMKNKIMFIHGLPPCARCASLIAHSGLKHVVINQVYNRPKWQHEFDTISKKIFKAAKINYEIIDNRESQRIISKTDFNNLGRFTAI
jgi:deoxycytidylate deaminase